MAVTMDNDSFWDMTRCSPEKFNRVQALTTACFLLAVCLSYFSILRRGVVRSSERTVYSCRSICLHISEDATL
jgi:hypothetical protein